MTAPFRFTATTTAGRIEELAKLLGRECPLGALMLAVAKTEDGTSPGIRERVRGRG
jgi:hypothetical protein